jgi:transcription-repair coupling factor (superfamily II helicase)
MILKTISDIFAASDEFREIEKYNLQPAAIEGISPGAFPLIISSFFNSRMGQTLVVVETIQQLNDLYLDLSCYVDDTYLYKFPSWETIPYEFMSPSETTERDRITALYRIISEQPVIVIATMESITRKIPSASFFLKKGLTLLINEDYPFDDIIETLVQYGYSRETRLESFGQFSVKGSIIDIFLPSMENPVRLDFFGDTLESIREFDINTQVSTGKGLPEAVTIYPRRELILFESEKNKIRNYLKENTHETMDLPDEIKKWLSDDNYSIDRIPGIEDFFHEITGSDTIDTYFDENHTVFMLESSSITSAFDRMEKNFTEIYEKRKKHLHCLPPEKLICREALIKAEKRAITIQTFTTTTDALTWDIKSIPGFQGKIKSVRDELGSRMSEGYKIIMTTSFEGQARRLADLFIDFNPHYNFESYDPDSPFNIVISPLNIGIDIAGIKTLILTDHEIFGKSYRKKRFFKNRSSRPIDTFLELKPGDYVVHINHGIGTFSSIERMSAGGVERDFIVIEYADSDKLYVSLDQINFVQKYIGIDGRKPRIDSLGRKSSWNRIKEKVQGAVEEIAGELIKIYAQRNALKGFRFPPDTRWQEEFESQFEFEETPDQITAIEDVKDDMEKDKPMDRLVCGDVGFGKTEVAIRSAFKAVMAGKQVAILVPTTVLAMQHFETFKKRFSGYPVNIEMMSRFRTRGEITAIKKKLDDAQIDIVIGTHAILAKDMKIKNLGLLIIDEEQRFGVKHKEELKRFRVMVDVLTLSATPIPRTLHMSMAGIRDLSIIATPPENRLPIETYVIEENPDILRQAILNEKARGGQVFFVHNRVQSIDTQMIILSKLVPEATCCIAHGQMNEHELEEVMIDFLNRKYDILISTTIIESGLDMPNVNTIIINRADTFGLSQLYQLKGRVGRSIKKAYAYLFYPRHTSLSEEAHKRLKVIAEYSDLGSGFKIAMKDLEIRGAGNILGREQSGSIMEVGFDLYCQMLEDAVKTLKGEEVKPYFRTSVFLRSDFSIPDSYIADDRQKIEFYKRFESCDTIDEVDSIESELIDRFGVQPPEVTMLVELERVRALASALMIDEILEDQRKINIRITSICLIPGEKLIKAISTDPRLKTDPKNTENLNFRPFAKSPEKKLTELKKWLQQFP